MWLDSIDIAKKKKSPTVLVSYLGQQKRVLSSVVVTLRFVPVMDVLGFYCDCSRLR